VEKVILTFSFVQRVDLPHSIRQPGSAFPAFLLAQAFKGCGQTLGVCCQICWCPGAAFDCLDASSDTLSAYCTATASLR